MSEAEMAYLESYICKRSKFYYRQFHYIDKINQAAYTDNQYFVADCKMNRWSNDKVRINYMLGVGNKENNNMGYHMRLYDGSNEKFDIYHLDKNTEAVQNATTFMFSKSHVFQNYFGFEYHKELVGNRARAMLWYTGYGLCG